MPRAGSGTAVGTEVTNAPPSRTHTNASAPSPDRVQTRVDAVHPFAANLVLEIIAGADDALGSQPARLIRVGVTHGHYNPRAARGGELRREPANHSSRARHKHEVAVIHPSPIHEQPSGQAAHRERAALGKAEGVRQRREDRGWHRNLLSERADSHPRLRHEPEHPPPIDCLAGKIPALNLRKIGRAAHPRERPIGSGQVPRPERRCPNVDQLLAIDGRRVGNVGELQPLEPRKRVQNDGRTPRSLAQPRRSLPSRGDIVVAETRADPQACRNARLRRCCEGG